MKFANVRAGWVTEGTLVGIFAANHPIDELGMAMYYGLQPGDKHYEEARRPIKYTRVILMRPNGTFVIVPIGPTTIEVPPEKNA